MLIKKKVKTIHLKFKNKSMEVMKTTSNFYYSSKRNSFSSVAHSNLLINNVMMSNVETAELKFKNGL